MGPQGPDVNRVLTPIGHEGGHVSDTKENRVKLFFWGEPQDRSLIKRVALKLSADYSDILRAGTAIYMEYLRPVSIRAGEEGSIDKAKAKLAVEHLKDYAAFLAMPQTTKGYADAAKIIEEIFIKFKPRVLKSEHLQKRA